MELTSLCLDLIMGMFLTGAIWKDVIFHLMFLCCNKQILGKMTVDPSLGGANITDFSKVVLWGCLKVVLYLKAFNKFLELLFLQYFNFTSFESTFASSRPIQTWYFEWKGNLLRDQFDLISWMYSFKSKFAASRPTGPGTSKHLKGVGKSLGRNY